MNGPTEDGQDQPDNPCHHRFRRSNRSGLSWRITSGSDGNLWFTIEATGEIGKINPTTDAITDFATRCRPDPSGSRRAPTATSGSPSQAQARSAPINPTTDAITEYAIPYAGSDPVAITAGPDGNLWFTDAGTNAIGVATLTTSQLVVTQQPPASVTAGSAFGLTVEAENSSGNLITSFNGTVTVALASNPGGATLGGTLTATASDGVATFSGLTLTTAAAGYTLDRLRQRPRRGRHERHHRDPRGGHASGDH